MQPITHSKDFKLKMNFLILNQNTDNFGDDIAAVALEHIIKSVEPSASLRFIYATPKWLNQVPVMDAEHIFVEPLNKSAYIDIIRFWLNQKKIFTLKYKNDSFQILHNSVDWADVILFSPCGANIGIYKDWNALKFLLAIVITKKKLVFHLNTIGLSGNLRFDLLAKFVLRRSKIFVRENRCIAELKEWGLIANQGPDTAFALPPIPRCASPNANQVRIGFIPTDLSWHPNHRSCNQTSLKLELINTIAKIAIAPNTEIILIPHLSGLQSESTLLHEIHNLLIEAGLGKDQIISNNHIINAFEYDKAIAKCDVVISMRYHGVVLSAKNGTPFISINYENKMNEVCRYTGMNTYSINIEDFSADQTELLIRDALKNNAEISQRLENATRRLSIITKYPIYEAWLSRL